MVCLSATGTEPDHIRLTEHPGALPRPPHTTGLFHAAIRLPNRNALAILVRRLIQQRAKVQGFSDHGVSEAIYLADPEGNGLELYADRPNLAWPRTDNHLAMVSNPLDVDELLAHAEDPVESWRGINPGTDIGHVHLQVSDLRKAEEFYHERLGFEITQRTYPGALFFAAGGYHHHIGVNVWAGKKVTRPPDNAVGLLAFSIVAPRPEVWRSATESGDSASNLRVYDPDGNAIELEAMT
jgi:catechol 2,3-dioxygenase